MLSVRPWSQNTSALSVKSLAEEGGFSVTPERKRAQCVRCERCDGSAAPLRTHQNKAECMISAPCYAL